MRHATAASKDGNADATATSRAGSATPTEFPHPTGLDKNEIALWADRAAVPTAASHAYSTRVFQAAPIGFVTLEVQAEHHLEPDIYVFDLLFSWQAIVSFVPVRQRAP